MLTHIIYMLYVYMCVFYLTSVAHARPCSESAVRDWRDPLPCIPGTPLENPAALYTRHSSPHAVPASDGVTFYSVLLGMALARAQVVPIPLEVWFVSAGCIQP